MIVSGTTNRFELEEGDQFQLDNKKKSPNSFGRPKPSITHLIIHCTEGPNVAAAVGTFMTPQRTSTHLILGKDGRELVQLVDFSRAGVHASQYNGVSIGVELDYPGRLTTADQPFYKSMKMHQEKGIRVIYACSLNKDDAKEPNYQFWPVYPKEQVDAMFDIAQRLMKKYPELTEIWGHEELIKEKNDPGPAFPIYQFREKLLKGKKSSTIFQETTRVTRVRVQPGATAEALTNATIPARTPVVVTNRFRGWCLVHVMAELGGNPWVVGWVEQNAVRIRRQPLKVVNQRLATHDGKLFPFIQLPIQNYGEKEFIKKHKYIVMHITTGTSMQSTINYFKDPVNRVSSHLLIGRDGQVLQFVPFDKKAYHAGDSWWEGDANINDFSIGIELDNAGFLKNEGGEWKRLTTVIPNNQVTLKTHWHENRERGWHNFTQIQLDVTMDVLKALKAEYGIEEILGHDQVNLRDRVDPGPLFPLEDFRAQLFKGRRQPVIKEYLITQETPIYALANGEPPDLKHSTFKDKLEHKAVVEIKEKGREWSLVMVVNKSGLSGQTGWVKTNSLEATDKVAKFRSSFIQPLFKNSNAKTPPPTEILGGPFPVGTRIRLQEEREKWVLVAVLDTVKGLKGLQGWVPKEFTNIGQGARGGRPQG